MDLEPLLAPLSATDPCGENLEYDGAFAELERAATGKPEQQIGNVITPATDPDWKLVDKHALALLQRSRDLRIACLWTKARLRTAGLPGLADGLSVLQGLVDRYWDGVHPRLDPDDGYDPTFRVNTLLGLAAPETLRALRNTPLVISRAVGRFSLRDIEIAAGEIPGPSEASTTPAAIEAAVLDAEVSTLAENANAANLANGALLALEALLADKIAGGHAPTFDALRALLGKIETFLGGALARRQQPAAGAAAPATNGSSSDTPLHRPVRVSVAGELSSREDVLATLDKIIGYYAKYEPSSPVPMFMERCKRLVTMSFLDIVRDLVPDAVPQVETLKGRPPE